MDVLAARDDHVVDATDDPEVAVLVDPADVARVVPAVADRLLVGVRPVPVAGERLVRAHVAEDLALAGRVEPQASVECGAAGAAGFRALVALDRERVDLRRAVVVHEDLGLERLGDALHERARHRRARVRDRAHRRRVEVAEARVVDEVVEEGGGEVERVDALALDQLQRLLGIPRRLRDEAAADDRGGEQGVDSHRVVERHDAERAVARRSPCWRTCESTACALGAMRARDALRASGGARRVELDRRPRRREVERARSARRRRPAPVPRRGRGSRPPRRSRRCSSRGRSRRCGARAARSTRRATGSPSTARPSRARSRARTRPGRRARRRGPRGRRRSARRARATPRTSAASSRRRAPPRRASARPRRGG